MPFEAHGDYKIWVEDEVIYAKLFDAWNKEAAYKFADEFKTLSEGFTSQWAHYVDLTEWQLCSPEVFEVVEQLVAWCIENGMRRAAQVYPDSIIKAQFIDKMVVEEIGPFKRAVFSNSCEACKWLTAEGFFASVD